MCASCIWTSVWLLAVCTQNRFFYDILCFQIISPYAPRWNIDRQKSQHPVGYTSDCCTSSKTHFSRLPFDCSHRAARKRKCERKLCAGESLITAESRWATSMQGEQLQSLREVSVRRSQSVQAALHGSWSVPMNSKVLHLFFVLQNSKNVTI